MYIRTTREKLLPVMNKVSGVVERRQTLPILGNLLFVVREQSVDVTATDLEIEIKDRLSATVEESGEVTVPARKFMDICRALPDGSDVSIRIQKERALVTSGRSRFALSTLPGRDFPVMDGCSGEDNLSIDQSRFSYLMEKTSFAMANQDVRYYLNGLLLEVHSDRLIAVATDGHRLAKVEVEIETGVGKDLKIILPRKTVLELNRLLVGGQENVDINISEKTFRATIGNTVLTSKLVDGRYPEYERVIPMAADKTALADKESLRQSLLRTSILSNEKYRGVRLNFEAGQLSLLAHNPEQEEAEEELEIKYEQDPTAIGFNVSYLLDVLNVLEGNIVEISFSDSNGSAVLRNPGQDKETFVVMPMRL